MEMSGLPQTPKAGIKLFVDDLRVAPEGWVLARTITEAVRILANFNVELVSLDHDIVYVDERGAFTGKVAAENYTPVAYFIREMPTERLPQTIYIHTANPDGARSLFSILKGKPVAVIRDATYAHEWLDLDDGEIPAEKE